MTRVAMLVLTALVALLAPAALGQTLLPAGGSIGLGRADPGDRHGWIILPESPTPQATVLHLPPRSGRGAADGAVRLARSLRAGPVAIAAQRSRVFMLFEPPPPAEAFRGMGQPKPRAVYSIGADRDDRGDWQTTPADRLDVHPLLSGVGTVVGLAASPDVLFALRRLDETPGTLALDILTASAWKPTQLPDPLFRGVDGEVTVTGTPQGVGILVTRQGRATWWAGKRLSPDPASEPKPEEPDALAPMRWASAEIDLPDDLAPVEHPVAIVSGTSLVIGGAHHGSWRWAAWNLSTQELPVGPVNVLPTLAVASPYAAMLPLEGVEAASANDRVVLARVTPNADPRQGNSIELCEVSVRTGRVLYDGRASLRSLVNTRDIALLAIAMTMLAGLVLAVVISPRHPAAVLPDDCSIAEPLRRGVAGIIDISIALFLVARIEQLGISEVASAAWWWSSPGQWTLAMVLGVLIVQGTLLEGLLGRTVGKSLTGCIVAGVGLDQGGEIVAPGIANAMIRNVLKWGVPPVGVLGLLDPGGRGRADLFARTAVLVRTPPEETDDE